jgi:hypothetical protein
VQEIIGVAITRLNIILSSVSVLFAFSLAAYLFVYNFRSAVARRFVLVLLLLTVVFVGDLFLSTARLSAEQSAARFWLEFQWLGIAFVAPAFLHFSDALLATTGQRSKRRSLAIWLAYLGGAIALASALGSEVLVGQTVGRPGSVYLRAGPLFPLFTLIYGMLAAWALANILYARRRTLTGRSHRRMTYLLVSSIAPMASFPWLILGGDVAADQQPLFGLVVGASNVATTAMLLVVAYSVAYQGTLTPDRAVKRELIKFLIQAPILGVFVLATLQLVPQRLQANSGLPRDVLFMLATVFGIVVYQLVVRAIKPLIDHLIYGDAGKDAAWLRRLDERLVTAEDMTQLLENILAAICDRLRVATGCVVVFSEGRAHRDVFTGEAKRTTALLVALDAAQLEALAEDSTFAIVEGFWLHILRPPEGGAALGLVAIEDPGRALDLAEEADFRSLIQSAEKALEDRLIQQRVIGALRELEPELAGIQRLRGRLEQGGGGPESLANPDSDSPVDAPEFAAWVKDALSHYWGGPKLTESPLLDLAVARDALERYDNNAAKAMREVLDRALESMKPEGERSLTASQWLMYNILELKFVRGLKVRDIASRLSMSESDLYRKQRVAIEALAGQVAVMESDPDDAAPSEADPARGKKLALDAEPRA